MFSMRSVKRGTSQHPPWNSCSRLDKSALGSADQLIDRNSNSASLHPTADTHGRVLNRRPRFHWKSISGCASESDIRAVQSWAPVPTPTVGCDTAKGAINRLGLGQGAQGYEWHKCGPWIEIQHELVEIILCRPNYNVTKLMQSIRLLACTNLEAHIPAYIEQKVLPNTMRILRQSLHQLQGHELLHQLGLLWWQFITFTVPTIGLIFALLPTSQNALELILLNSFYRDVVKKVEFKEALEQATRVDHRIEHMCNILFTFCRGTIADSEASTLNQLLWKRLRHTC